MIVTLGDTFKLKMDRPSGKIGLIDPATLEINQARMGSMDLRQPVHLRLVADGSVIDVYANDVWLFSEQRANPTDRTVSMEILQGDSQIDSTRLDQLKTWNKVYQYGLNY